MPTFPEYKQSIPICLEVTPQECVLINAVNQLLRMLSSNHGEPSDQ
jgi:hypothetical protein